MTINQNFRENDFRIKNEKILIAAGIIGLVLVVLAALFICSRNQRVKIDELKPPIVQDDKGSFASLVLSARAAAVYDVEKKRFIFLKNEKDILPLASLTKLMTALVAEELLPSHSTVKIAKEYLEGENSAGLLADERWTADDLIALTLFASSNAGARTVAFTAGAFLPTGLRADPEKSFVEYLNRRAANLGLLSMRFYNDSGLDIDTEHSGAYGNVKDAAILFNRVLSEQPELLEPTKYSRRKFISADQKVHDVKNTNAVIEDIPGALASKTGFTDLAQGNLAIAFSPGLEGPYVAVVLGSTYDDRFGDIAKLVSATLKASGRMYNTKQ